MKMKTYIKTVRYTGYVLWLTATSLLGANAQSQAEKAPKGTIHLFNGQDLGGWYTFIKDRGKNQDPKGVFTVDNGVLRISGEEWGCITTNDTYADYRLVMEFKWGKKTYGTRKHRARDNGILFHSVGEDGGYAGTWMHSIECNIIEGGVGDFIVVGDGSERFSITCPVASERHGTTPVYQAGGELVEVNRGRVNWYGRDPNWIDTLGFRGARDVDYPVGQWNTLECVVKGDAIDIYVNGILVNQAIHVRPSEGRIQVQSEGAEMFVRRLDLIPLVRETKR